MKWTYILVFQNYTYISCWKSNPGMYLSISFDSSAFSNTRIFFSCDHLYLHPECSNSIHFEMSAWGCCYLSWKEFHQKNMYDIFFWWNMMRNQFYCIFHIIDWDNCDNVQKKNWNIFHFIFVRTVFYDTDTKCCTDFWETKQLCHADWPTPFKCHFCAYILSSYLRTLMRLKSFCVFFLVTGFCFFCSVFIFACKRIFSPSFIFRFLSREFLCCRL